MNRRHFLLSSAAALALPAVLPAGPAQAAESVLRVATTLADIPLTTGQPSQGAEGQRFIGLQLYDALINWDLSKRDTAARLQPGLALSWSVDEASKKTWTFRLRPGVTFHDGSPFTAADVVWNLDKLLKRDAPQYDQLQAVQAVSYVLGIESYAAPDPLTVTITTKQPDAVFPYLISNVYLSGPRRWEELGRDWKRVADRPSGTGPWMMDRLVPRQRAELVRNPAYWDKARIPKADRQILLVVPDGNTRVSALLSGQVDWAEAPAPDAVERLRSGGMQVVTNLYPHIWPYQVSFTPDSPLRELKVRQALNLGVNREELCALLGGTAVPAKGMVDEKHPWFGKPSFQIGYDPGRAQALMAEAGYGSGKRLKLRAIVSPSGSGQMQPMPMNEFIQESWRAIYVDLEFEVMEWEALRARRRSGAQAPENKGMHFINNSWGYWDPAIGLTGPALSRGKSANDRNWGGFEDAEADRLAEAATNAFDPAEQDRLLAQLHERIVDQAMWIWFVHDLNPRALAPKVTGFVQAQSWYQDLTPVLPG